MRTLIYSLVCWFLGGFTQASAQPAPIIIDDFEQYTVGSLPLKWRYLSGKKTIPITQAPPEKVPFRVLDEPQNKFLQVVTRGTYARILQVNREDFHWDLTQHPYLRWRWRAVKLPEGANEKDKKRNDTGGALYVTFSFNFLGIPRSIKYTYSSTLPVGTIISYGSLKVIVVSSGQKEDSNQWITISRNVAEDYRRLFRKKPPRYPVSITLWSDSDSTGDTAIVDFDDIALFPTSNHQ